MQQGLYILGFGVNMPSHLPSPLGMGTENIHLYHAALTMFPQHKFAPYCSCLLTQRSRYVQPVRNQQTYNYFELVKSDTVVVSGGVTQVSQGKTE